jgi:rod shape-determining protein MreD
MARCIIAGVIATYVLAVVQTTVGAAIAISGVSPDLLLVWTITIGLLSGPYTGGLVGFAAGMLQGALFQTWIGAYAFSKTLSGFAAGLLATKMFKENLLVPAISAALLTVGNEGVFLLFARGADLHQAGRVIGLRALYHAVLTPIAFALTRRARRAFLGEREGAL